MKLVQDQKGFSGGQSNPCAFARIDNETFKRAIKLENVIVDKEGSACVRGGFEKASDIQVYKGFKILDVIKVFKLGETFLFLVKTDVQNQLRLIYKIEGSEYCVPIEFKGSVLSYDLKNVHTSAKKPSGDYVLEEQLAFFSGHTSFDPHGFPEDDVRQNILNADQMKDRVFIFFENCFPWKVWVEGNVVKSAPFFEGELNSLWKCFPFGRTVEGVSVRDMVLRQGGNVFVKYRDEDEELELNISKVSWDVSQDSGSCEIYLDYFGKDLDRDFVDTKLASCSLFKGQPILFSMGNRELSLDGRDVSEWGEIAQNIAALLNSDVAEALEEGEPQRNEGLSAVDNNFIPVKPNNMSIARGPGVFKQISNGVVDSKIFFFDPIEDKHKVLDLTNGEVSDNTLIEGNPVPEEAYAGLYRTIGGGITFVRRL